MGPTEIFRPTFSRVLAYALWVLLAFIAISAAVGTSGSVRLRVITGCIFAATIVVLFYFRPYVEVSDGGILLANPLKTTMLPWPAIESTEIHGSFNVQTVDGMKHSSYAATIANKRNDLGLAGEVKKFSDDRLEALSAAGYLNDIRPEGAPVTVTRNIAGLAAISATALAFLITLFT
jgi:hypothetical protein